MVSECVTLILSSNILYVHLKLYVAVTHSLEELEVERDGSVKTCLVVISSMENNLPWVGLFETDDKHRPEDDE